MKAWGVFKAEQVGDIDYVLAENLIVCFEKEEDAKVYRDIRNNPRTVDGEGELTVHPVRFVTAGEYDPANNYGLAKNEHEGCAFICECGHATVIPWADLPPRSEEIQENGCPVGVRLYVPFTCELCKKNQFAVNEVRMFNDPDDTVRREIANYGYNLENYIYDPSSLVREAVALKGVGHDVFVANPNEHPAVLRVIAKKGKYLDILKDHPDKTVSSTAIKELKKQAANP